MGSSSSRIQRGTELTEGMMNRINFERLTIAELKQKIAAFTELYGIEPRATIAGRGIDTRDRNDAWGEFEIVSIGNRWITVRCDGELTELDSQSIYITGYSLSSR